MDDEDTTTDPTPASTRRRLLQTAGVAGALGLAGCLGGGTDTTTTTTATDEGDGGGGAAAQQAIGDGELVLATTTSTYDTGLLDALNPMFEATFGVTVKTLVQGTGAAIRTAENGDADVILVHARGAEDAFLRAGHGTNRRDVMFNDFVIVGPEDDPAGIGGMESATEAFATIAETESVFVSRGDDSGTNKKELAVWAAADVQPSGSWYREVGKGMGDTLIQADQTGAYTLSDRGTFLATQDKLSLVIEVQGPLKGGPAILKNPYGVIPVNPAKHDNVNYLAAMAYAAFLTSPAGQTAIDEYRANGSQLFFPNALAPEPDFAQYVPADYDGATRADLRFDHWVATQVPEDF